MSQIPEYEELRKMAEDKLGKALNGKCSIRLVKGYNEEILKIIMRIDHTKFREELQYDTTEIRERMEKPGFMCFLIYLDGEPIAFEYGYDDGKFTYFSDSQATLIEGKGVGTTQFALEILYLYHKGYTIVRLSTEEQDELGRTLRNFWEKMGFVVINNKKGNLDMELKLTPEAAQYQYQKYIQPRK
jgi:hypothetical protein